jgi:hypothetical protein
MRNSVAQEIGTIVNAAAINIARGQVFATFYRSGQTPPMPVRSVKPLRVSSKKRLQHLRRRCLLHFQEQMKMIEHQNIGVEVKRLTLSCHRQTVEKLFL